jgi:hypothetical protein
VDRFCAYEEERFPEDEFESSDEYRWVHERDPRHTIRGKVIPDDDDGEIPGADLPGPPAPPPDSN